MGSVTHKNGDEMATCRMLPTKDERSFKRFLWNPKTKTVLGRNGASWAKIGLFYLVFYAFLAGFFSVLMAAFYQTLDNKVPKYTGAESLLVNPGLGFLPRSFVDDLRPTIVYDPTCHQSSIDYVASINNFLKAYTPPRPPSSVDCMPGDAYRSDNDPPCYFDLTAVNTSCSPDDLWGYSSNSPCIFLKVNKMFHWLPRAPENFEGLPEGLQRHINASDDPETVLKENLWVWCESDEIEIEQPSPGLPLSFFPYLNQDGYLAPFSTIRLLNLTVGQEAQVHCRVWISKVHHRIDSEKTREVKILVHLHP